MRQNLKNNAQLAGRLAGRLAAEKKKTAIALCLIALMVFMWIRVLGKKGPQGAEASLVGQMTDTAKSVSKLKISFMELPHIKERHDSLTRDFSVVESWRDFIDGPSESDSHNKEVNVVAEKGFEEVAKLVSEKLKLEVIELGNVPQAFISGKILTKGDKLEVSDGANKYQCEVLKIEKNAVYLRCGSTEVQLKLVQSTEETASR
jgi:hypothetical protein